MEFLKKHWQKIVIIISTILFLSMCASNCSNKNKIRDLNNTYSSTDSIINSLNDTISFYKLEVKELKRDIKDLESKNDLLMKSNSDLNSALKRKVVVNISTDKDEK